MSIEALCEYIEELEAEIKRVEMEIDLKQRRAKARNRF